MTAAAPRHCMNQPWLARLAGERVRLEGGEEERGFGHVLDRGELAVDRVLQHDVLDDVLLGDAELLPCSGIRLSTRGVRTKPG